MVSSFGLYQSTKNYYLDNMHEFNDGLRPHYDEDFDEAIRRNSDGHSLESKHVEALIRFTAGGAKPEELAEGRETVLTHK